MQLRVGILALLAVCAAAQFSTGEYEAHGPLNWDWIKEMVGPIDASTPRRAFTSFMSNIVKAIPPELIQNRPYPPKPKADPTKFGPWFAWVPLYQASGIPSQPAQSWSAPCFANNSISADFNGNSAATLTISTTNPSSLLCSDWYLVATVEGVSFHTFSAWSSVGVTTLHWNFSATISPAEMEDVKRNGFRVYRFLNDFVTTLIDLYDTAMLFIPALTGPSIPLATQQANLQFLQNYSAITMDARTMTQPIYPDASQFQSGDFLGIIRLDGLDEMLAWAMGGSHTGHTTIALKIDGEMKICESTTKDGYWPVNGVQCTPVQQWITLANTAMYNTVWLPLSAESRAKFNETAAVEFMKANMGLDYGYANILFGWLDNLDNYPYPLTWQLHMLLPALIGKVIPSLANQIWNRGLRMRLGITDENMPAADIYAEMYTRGMDFNDLVFTVEQDDWLYTQVNNNNQTVKGRSMVCDVLVCAVWKAAGVFGDTQFNCAEATNWDIYTLNVFDPAPQRLPACVQADPDLPFCQLTGNYRLTLPQWNTRQVYPNSFNNCPRGSPPDWNKPVGC